MYYVKTYAVAKKKSGRRRTTLTLDWNVLRTILSDPNFKKVVFMTWMDFFL